MGGMRTTHSGAALATTLRRVLEPPRELRPPPGEVPAAVLVPVLTGEPEPRLVFTKRADTLSRHAGEISFPGGLLNPSETPVDAALRESEEELGLARAHVEVVGMLPPVQTHVSGIMIVPLVGVLGVDPLFTPNNDEIDVVLEYPLPALVAASAERDLEHDGRRFRTYVFEMGNHTIWGATARILRSFLDVVGAADAETGG